MRFAIFSDVHANLPALEAVLADIECQQVDAVYCLGDLVGYAPFPNEVIDRIRASRIATVMGNYDDGVGSDLDDCGCGHREAERKRLGALSFAWTKAHTSDPNKAFLRTLVPNVRLVNGGMRLLLVHGSPRKINESLLEDRPVSSFQRIAACADADVIVCGHTHRPYVRHTDPAWFVNVGSVGRPKDGDWRACYAVVDAAASPPATFVRVPYDLESVTTAIRKSDLPDVFAEDLESAGASFTLL
jgi:putative phosphoesterase